MTFAHIPLHLQAPRKDSSFHPITICHVFLSKSLPSCNLSVDKSPPPIYCPTPQLRKYSNRDFTTSWSESFSDQLQTWSLPLLCRLSLNGSAASQWLFYVLQLHECLLVWLVVHGHMGSDRSVERRFAWGRAVHSSASTCAEPLRGFVCESVLHVYSLYMSINVYFLVQYI